ncbi:MAG: hypothetical protein AB7F59_10805 [Bdellovibrionales bacterium]
MKKLILLISLLVGTAQAQVGPLFKSMEAQPKGPFGLNILQGPNARVAVTEAPPENFQFQAAFRNDVARKLAVENDFYVGNLYTTNYYELMGEYVYGNAYGNHALNHAALLAQNARAMVKAESMVRHWVLEKHYIGTFKTAKLARSFVLRGISGTEFEQAYATHFFNFYLSSMSNDFQFLPAFLLVKTSPIAGSASLERARLLIGQIYDEKKEAFSSTPSDSRVTRLYSIRNVIHNQLTPAAIDMIDGYIKDFPATAEEKYVDLLKVREMIVQYYSITIEKVLEFAKALNAPKVMAAATQIKTEGRTIPNLLALSQAITEIKTNIIQVPTATKARTLLLLVTSTQYISKEIGLLARFDMKEIVEIVVNLIYIEGFLIKDNWEYFVSEIRTAADVTAAASQLLNIIEIATDTLNQVFNKSFQQWKEVEPRMQGFVDNTLKSSGVSVASTLLEKIKR